MSVINGVCCKVLNIHALGLLDLEASASCGNTLAPCDKVLNMQFVYSLTLRFPLERDGGS